MVKRAVLTPELVDSLEAPASGERWVADESLKGFGVRLWAGGGRNAAYAIRVRDKNGKARRETFSVWHDGPSSWEARQKARQLGLDGNFTFPLGAFLDDARRWAKERIKVQKGGTGRIERRNERYRRAAESVKEITLEGMAIRALRRIEISNKSDNYSIQLQKLFGRLSEEIRASLIYNVNIRNIAAEIAHPSLPVWQSRALQSFIGQVYARANKWHGPGGRISDAITRRVAWLREKQSVPHPRILEISDSEISSFLIKLEGEKKFWREALALRIYFETGAKLRRVLSARWDQIISDTWYPYSYEEREFWFMGRESINDTCKHALSRCLEMARSEGISSDYIFPSKTIHDRSITTVRRYWLRISAQLGWKNLPLSHIVQRYNPRNTPSYTYMCYHLMVPISSRSLDPEAVSKFGKPII